MGWDFHSKPEIRALIAQAPRPFNCCFASSWHDDSHGNVALPSFPTSHPLHHRVECLQPQLSRLRVFTRSFGDPCFPVELDLQSTESDSDHGLENTENDTACLRGPGSPQPPAKISKLHEFLSSLDLSQHAQILILSHYHHLLRLQRPELSITVSKIIWPSPVQVVSQASPWLMFASRRSMALAVASRRSSQMELPTASSTVTDNIAHKDNALYRI